MADIEVKIDLQETELDTIDKIKTTNNVSNVSIPLVDGEFSKIATKNNGANLKSWATGYLSLFDGFVGGKDTQLVEQGGYNGYVFGAVDDNGELEVSIEINGANIDSIIIYGDKKANQFAIEGYIGDDATNIIYSDDNEFEVKFNEAGSIQKITFTKWNRANYNACITSIGVIANELFLGKQWIKNIEILSESNPNAEGVFYGITGDTGSLEFVDVDGRLKDYAESGIISKSNLPIEIYVNKNKVRELTTLETTYNSTNKNLQFNVSNSINLFDKSELAGRNENTVVFLNQTKNMDYMEYGLGTLLNVLLMILRGSGDRLEEIAQRRTKHDVNAEVETTIYQYLQNIKFPFVLYSTQTYKELLDSALSFAQLSLIKKDNGSLELVSMRPYKMSDEKVVYIPKSNQFSPLTTDVILNNKYTNTTAQLNVVAKDFKEVVSQNYYLRDANNNLVLSGINDTATSFVASTGRTNICFFLTIESQNPIYDFMRTRNATNQRPIVYEVYIDDSRSTYNYGYTTSNETKENFEFKDTGGVSTQTEITLLTRYTTASSNTFAIKIDVTKDISEVQSIRLSMKANTYNFNNLGLTYNSSTDNICELPTSSIYFTDVYYQDETSIPIFDYVSQCVLKDYKTGLHTAKISISCDNYYYKEDNVLAKDWRNGQVVELHDIVSIEGDNRLWRVVGRNFRKNGVPMVDLTLKEIKT